MLEAGASGAQHEVVIAEIQGEYAVFRRALRECLHLVGVPSNPGWSDENIVLALSDKLGIESPYQHTKAMSEALRFNRDVRESDSSSSLS